MLCNNEWEIKNGYIRDTGSIAHARQKSNKKKHKKKQKIKAKQKIKKIHTTRNTK